MNCPLCVDQALVPHHRGGIEIDVCPHCHGIWLDRGELDRFAALPESPRPAELDRFDLDGTVDDGGTVHDRADGRSEPKGKREKTRRKKGLAQRLGDVLEDVLDL